MVIVTLLSNRCKNLNKEDGIRSLVKPRRSKHLAKGAFVEYLKRVCSCIPLTIGIILFIFFMVNWITEGIILSPLICLSDDWSIFIATLMSPIIALGISRTIEDGRFKKERKLKILRTLMTYRDDIGAPEFSGAINLLDVEFFENEKIVKLRKDFQDLAHIQPYDADKHKWCLVDIILEIARSLGIKNFEQKNVFDSYKATIHRWNIFDDFIKGKRLIEMVETETPGIYDIRCKKPD